jgi:hypothetical protein
MRKRRMMARYAVLWDIDSKESQPVGIALEHDDRVVVNVPWWHCVPLSYSEPYSVLGPAGVPIVVEPGDPDFFENVLVELSHTFAIGERDSTDEAADDRTMMRLLHDKVLSPGADREYRAQERETARVVYFHYAAAAGGMVEVVTERQYVGAAA